MIIEKKKIRIENSDVIINNGFAGKTVATANTSDERAKCESFSSSSSSSGHSFFANSSSEQVQTAKEEHNAKLEEMYNRCLQHESLINGSFNDKVVKETINITNSKVTINNSVNDSSSMPKVTNHKVSNTKSKEAIANEHRQIKSRFIALSSSNYQVMLNLCNDIKENKIVLKDGQQEEINERIEIARAMETKFQSMQILFQQEKDQLHPPLNKLEAINKLFTSKLAEYAHVVEYNKDLASTFYMKDEEELLDEQINALQKEIELVGKKTPGEKSTEVQAREMQVTNDIPETNSTLYNSICYIASYFNPYSYFKK